MFLKRSTPGLIFGSIPSIGIPIPLSKYRTTCPVRYRPSSHLSISWQPVGMGTYKGVALFQKVCRHLFSFKLPGSYGAVVCNMMYCQTEKCAFCPENHLAICMQNTHSRTEYAFRPKTYLRLNRLLRLFGAVVGKMFFGSKVVLHHAVYIRARIFLPG